jgi:hypothetical protein
MNWRHDGRNDGSVSHIEPIEIVKSVIPGRKECFSEIPLERADHARNSIDHLHKPVIKGVAMKKTMKESAETPKMEAGAHSSKFLKQAVKAKLSQKAASKIRATASKMMKGY